MRSPLLMVAALAAVLLFGTPPALAQSGLGGLRGVVTDAQGGALPGRHRDRHLAGHDRPTGRCHERARRVPPHQPLARHLQGHRGAARLCHLHPRRHPDPDRLDLPGQRPDADQRAAGDGHRLGRIADDRGGQAEQRPQHRRRVPALDADPGAPQLQRLPRAHARRHLARLRRRERPAGVLRPCHRAFRARPAAREHAGDQLSRRPAHLRLDGRRHGAGHPGQDRRRRRIVTDGRWHRDERDHQERRQLVPGDRRVRLPAVWLERRQRRQLQRGAGLQAGQRRHTDHCLRPSIRRVVRRPDHA